MHPLHLCRTLYRHRPGDPPLNELLHLRPQLGLCQTEVIDRASTKNRQAWKPSTAAVHKRPARLAKVIRHECIGANRFGLTKGCEVILATNVFEMRVRNCDVGLVEGRADFAAVDAVTDVAVDQAGLLEWQNQLHGATKACSSGFILGRPAVVRKIDHSDALIVEGTHYPGVCNGSF